MRFLEFEEINEEQWEALARKSAVSTFFQTKACYEFYDGLPFVEAFVFGVAENGQLKGIVVGYIQKDGGRLKQFFSRRAIINGGPILAEDISDEEITELLDRCKQQLKGKAIFVETRNFDDYSLYKAVFEKVGFVYEPHYNFHVDTSSNEIVEANMGKSRKRDVKTSLRNGATIVEEPSLDDVKAFYAVLENLYRTKVKTPLFPFSFFERLYQSSFGRFLLVKYADRIVGGTVCVCGEDTVYEWFACGEDGVYKNIYPSTLATYAGIRYAADHGYRRFDMMGAGAPGDGGYGVRDFKAKFGGQLVEHGRFKCVLNKSLYQMGTVAVNLIRKL